jgi:hypothetical protein
MPPITRQQLQGFRDAHRALVKPEKVAFFEFKIYEAIIAAATAGHGYYNCPIQLDSEVGPMDDERLPEYCVNDVIKLLYVRFPDCTIRYISPGMSNKKDWRTTLGHKAYLQVIWS